MSQETHTSVQKDEADALDERGALFARLYREGRLQEALSFCTESLTLLGHSEHEARVEWSLRLCIIFRELRMFDAALAVHLITLPLVTVEIAPTIRGKFHNGSGRTYELLGRHQKALEQYKLAMRCHALGDDELLIAGSQNNAGRVLTNLGKPEESHVYFDRGEVIAKQFEDVRLLGEILESRALAFESQNRFKEAQEAASRSVSLLFGTEHRDALRESIETRDRIENQFIRGAFSLGEMRLR